MANSKYFVTLTPEIRTYTNSSMYEEVYADGYRIDPTGALIFFDRHPIAGGVSDRPIVAYAPGTWVLFTEELEDEE